MIQASISEAVQDARIMASMFYKTETCLDVWYHVFTALEEKYEPFLSDIFRDEFYHHISQHRNFKTLESEIWGDI